EAARRLWHAAGWPATYPADLAIVADAHGRPHLVRLGPTDDRPVPAVSIAHTEGVAVALAAIDPDVPVGIDVEAIADRPDRFEGPALTAGERSLCRRWQGSRRAEWVARFGCTKQAAAKAAGMGLATGADAEVVRVDEDSGVLHVRLAPR